MLLVYTFVFSVVFRVKWPGSDGGSVEYGVNSFVGMIVFSLFSESLSRAPSLVLQNANLVKKVVFPLEVLPWVTLASSLFHVLVNYIVLLVFVLFIKGSLAPTVLLFPLVIVPVALLALGLSWFLSSIGVFFRDMSHTVALLVSVWMFVSPIFYPLSAVPPGMRRFLELNPLAPLIDDGRSVALLGVIPELSGYLWICAISAAVAWGRPVVVHAHEAHLCGRALRIKAIFFRRSRARGELRGALRQWKAAPPSRKSPCTP